VAGGILGFVKMTGAGLMEKLLHPWVVTTIVVASTGAFLGLSVMRWLVVHNYVWLLGIYEFIPMLLAFFVAY